MKILAIDLGKFKSTACVLETTSNDHVFHMIRTVAGEVHDLLALIQPDRVVIEIGSSAGWVKDLAETMGLIVDVPNLSSCYRLHHFLQFNEQRRNQRKIRMYGDHMAGFELRRDYIRKTTSGEEHGSGLLIRRRRRQTAAA